MKKHKLNKKLENVSGGQNTMLNTPGIDSPDANMATEENLEKLIEKLRIEADEKQAKTQHERILAEQGKIQTN